MLTDKITEYLSAGGLFNPELMDHDAVRDLLMKCRNELDRLRKKCDENNMPEQLAVVPGAKTDENQ
jgi:hypothetical protein